MKLLYFDLGEEVVRFKQKNKDTNITKEKLLVAFNDYYYKDDRGKKGCCFLSTPDTDVINSTDISKLLYQKPENVIGIFNIVQDTLLSIKIINDNYKYLEDNINKLVGRWVYNEEGSDIKLISIHVITKPEYKGLFIPKDCYEDYGQDLGKCGTQDSEGCGRCNYRKKQEAANKKLYYMGQPSIEMTPLTPLDPAILKKNYKYTFSYYEGGWRQRIGIVKAVSPAPAESLVKSKYAGNANHTHQTFLIEPIIEDEVIEIIECDY